MHGFVSYRRFRRAQSLRNDQAVDRALARTRSLRRDRAGCVLGRDVATELWLELSRPSRVCARSLRSDRAWLFRGLIAILELARGRFHYVPVPLDNRYLVRFEI
ncbi:hypothetical protein F2Q69_00059121 [Brassica cretica]|uniref:Uncharacterized protein n=1 Tax=Brassica cretica TaxID=69181 RepID=A0A8S9RBD3_BRACR|nr:hypothetical protein F2Q69_00059121 [Brassica cretica]